MRIAGIDPGSSITAYGIIDTDTKQSEYGFLKIPSKLSHEEKIYRVYSFIKDVIVDNSVDSLALEGSFYSVNIQSAMLLSQIRAAVIIASKECNIDISQYQPKQIKQSVCGYGSAKKEQVRFIVEQTLKIKLDKQPLDVSDALSVALAHMYAMNF
jgi:crossover junction endodeoxyribonuclease RuvC